MRTTIDIDDDILAAAEEIAAAQNTSVGAVISDLARQFLKRRPSPGARYRNGFWVLPKRGGGVVTPELVDRLAEDDIT
jgi:predicted transcriptional regulator